MDKKIISLDRLPLGKTANVISLHSTGCIHKRLQDIGLVAGTSVTALQKSPSQDPTAYLIRSAVIAIRSEDAALVSVEVVSESESDDTRVIALSGNPNVGKSTLFNQLTGLRQYTGNWAGKTVVHAKGYYTFNHEAFTLVDIPGTYSLTANSAEEAAARDFICFGDADTIVVVCDATCLERNLPLLLQTMEISTSVILCLNLIDEAHRKQIVIDYATLEMQLGISVLATQATKKHSLAHLMSAISSVKAKDKAATIVSYDAPIEQAISILEEVVQENIHSKFSSRWIALKLLENDLSFLHCLSKYLGYSLTNDAAINDARERASSYLDEKQISQKQCRDLIVQSTLQKASAIANSVVSAPKHDAINIDRKIDKILTGRLTGIPLMIALLVFIFWLSISASNYPSQLIASILFALEAPLLALFTALHTPTWVADFFVFGVYRVVAWVVAVMLPPMAIFFPLFTILEDFGVLPRIAFNLDTPFKKCSACGKQALTMCMGFGCNASAIVGCRIIDSPRERLIALITNNFVPCNGRFPTLIVIITMFYIPSVFSIWNGVFSALILTSLILCGIMMTFLMSHILSTTILKGQASAFTLELPPYRKPQFGEVIVRSLLDRTLFVLGRALVVALPAGAIIWLMANLSIGDTTILSHCTTFLDPFAQQIGLDGVILMAFILGFPANEIVIPIMVMAYLAEGSLLEIDNLSQFKQLLLDNNWTWLTALCTMIFSLMHWPCSTTCLTIKKETQSLKWTFLAFLIPTLAGILVCFTLTTLVRML